MAAKKSKKSINTAASTKGTSASKSKGAPRSAGSKNRAGSDTGSTSKGAPSKTAVTKSSASKGVKKSAAGGRPSPAEKVEAPAAKRSLATNSKSSPGVLRGAQLGADSASAKPRSVKTTGEKGSQKTQEREGRATPNKTLVLSVGDTVPEFEALNQDGELVQSRMLSGAPYVIYFYPKDDTPGCTTEACGFRDEAAVFADQGVKVIGVSPDSPASHARFRLKYGLGFTLLADTEKKLVSLFGVWKLKQNYGREYWGVERSTFLVDASGKIAKEWRGVKVAGHVPSVLDAAKQL